MSPLTPIFHWFHPSPGLNRLFGIFRSHAECGGRNLRSSLVLNTASSVVGWGVGGNGGGDKASKPRDAASRQKLNNCCQRLFRSAGLRMVPALGWFWGVRSHCEIRNEILREYTREILVHVARFRQFPENNFWFWWLSWFAKKGTWRCAHEFVTRLLRPTQFLNVDLYTTAEK